MNHLFELPRLRRIAAGVSLACLFGTAGLAQASVADHHEFEATLHVPFKGGGPAIVDLLGGQIQMAFSSVPAVLPHIRTGKLVALGVGSGKRTPALPNVPTIAEAGVAGYEYTTWYGIFAPVKTPRPLIAKLNAEIVKAVESPDIKDRFLALGGDPEPGTPEALRDYMASESAKWAKIIKAGNIRVD